MKHNTTLFEYLSEFNCGEEYTRIDDSLRATRSKNSPWSINYYTHRGMSVEDALKEIDNKKKNRKVPTTCASSPDHWVSKGMKTDAAIARSQEWLPAIGKCPTLTSLSIRYGPQIGKQKWDQYLERNKNKRSIRLARVRKETTYNEKELSAHEYLQFSSSGRWGTLNCFNYFDDYKSYIRAVNVATRLSLRVYKNLLDLSEITEEIDPELLMSPLSKNSAKKGFAIDHKYSKYGGFYNKIDPLRLGCIENLRIVTLSENSAKGQFCIIELEELMRFKTILDDPDIAPNIKEKIYEIFNQKN